MSKMTLLSVWIACSLAVWSGAATEAKPSGRPLQLVDLTDDYDRVWTQVQSLPVAQRSDAFRSAFAQILPGFYDPKRMEKFGATEAKYREYLDKMLEQYPSRRADIMRVSSEFSGMFNSALATFERAFGRMTDYPPIYLVNSQNEFDGGTRDLPEGTRLLFGADMIARLYKDKPVQPFFHHELFHLYHARTFPECEELWCSLWAEGLATYVAEWLNPGAGDEALLLNSPVPLRPAVETNRVEAVCAVVSRLDSKQGKDYAPLFSTGGKPLSATLPHRFGYYVGYRVASDLGKGRTLKQLARLTHKQVRPLIEKTLRDMAPCD